MRRVVITGVGMVSVLGLTRDSIAQALYYGRSGIVFEPERLEQGMRSGLTGRITDFDTGRFLNRKQRKSMPDFAVQAHAAVMDALQQAQLAPEQVRYEDCGLVFGNDSSVLACLEQATALRDSGSTMGMGSGHVFRCMNSTISMNLNALLGNLGPSWTISSACASGSHAVGMAADYIRLGRLNRVICGAAQETGWQAVSAFDGLGAFSLNPSPEHASRPFDANRDGLVPSGGAAALVLEDYALALQRGAPILGEILGFGCSSDGEGLAAPSHSGLARAMSMALSEAHVTPADIDIINAHATSTPRGDAAEAANIRAVFSSACPPVTALKSLTGHELWMSGAAQVAYAAIMSEKGFTAGTRNFAAPDVDTAGLPILTRSLDRPPGLMLCNAAGFGGSNACLVVRF